MTARKWGESFGKKGSLGQGDIEPACRCTLLLVLLWDQATFVGQRGEKTAGCNKGTGQSSE